jgi:Zn-dependent peptidase ImmA (M78 family)
MARLSVADLPPRAAEIISNHQTEAPVKVGAIARDLGLTVLISDLPLNISGILSRNKPNENIWTVRVNRHEHKNRQRYTIAHEISHFILHRDAISDKVTDDKFYRSGLSEKREFEANALAAEILMPWHLIRRLMSQYGSSVADLAQALEVSEAAMHIRLGLPT